MRALHVVAITILMAGSIPLLAQKEGEPAPDFEVALLESDTFRLSDHEGKVVMVFFFGNTCPSCVSAGSKVESDIYQVFKDDASFTAVGIDTWNTSSNESSVSGFRSNTGISFPLGLMGGDIAANYQTTYDRLLVIDQQGTLVHKGILVAGNDINNALAAINESLAISGIETDPLGSRVNVFPNPVSDYLHLVSEDEQVVRIALYDLTGKLVLEMDFPDGQGSSSREVSVQHLDHGVYLYAIQTGRQNQTGKLLIQR